jgi:hypothetical protein
MMFAVSPVWSLCIERDGTAVVESVFQLCCTLDSHHSCDRKPRGAVSCSDDCRDIFLTLEATTESSKNTWALDVTAALCVVPAAHDVSVSLRPQFPHGEAVSIGHAGSSLLCLRTVRLLT